MTALKFLIEADDGAAIEGFERTGKVADAAMWGELIADLRQMPERPRIWRRAAIAVAAVAALGLAAAAGYVAAPDPAPAPDPVIVVCQEQDPAACVEMPAVR